MKQFPCGPSGVSNTSFIRGGGNRLFAHLAVCLALSSVCVSAAADEILVEGARYRGVLVLKSSSNYYVQIPWEGRTISVRTEKVDESTVSINEDPFYRDELQRQYREAKKLRDAGKIVEVKNNPLFQVQARSPSAAHDPFRGGGMAGAGIGVPRTQLESMLASVGMQFRAGPGRNGMPSVVAQMPNNGRMELIGPPNRLMGIEVTVTVSAAELRTVASQIQGLLAQSSPEGAAEFEAMFKEAEQSGQSQRTIDGVSATIAIQKSGNMVEYKATVMTLD